MHATESVVTASNTTEANVRSVADALSPLDQLALHSFNLVRKPLPTFEFQGKEFFLPRYLFIGPTGGGDPIRVGLFAGVYGDEPEGSLTLIDFLHQLDASPEIARDFCLLVYPILNPTGFEANTRLTASGASGVNIPTQIWRNTVSPEVQALQSELWMHGFDGIISFRSDGAAREITVAIGGSIFFRHFLGAALPTSQDILPQVVRSDYDALPRWKSVLLDKPNELIRAAPGLKPRPFEIVITLPRQVPFYLVKSAVSLILQNTLAEYRRFIAFGANI